MVFFITVYLFLISLKGVAQKNNEAFQLHIHRTSTPIKVDGLMNDKAWKLADSTSPFFMVLPMDTSLANVKTEVRMCYDDHNFYLLAVCYKNLPGHYFVESLRRDFAFQKNDNFIVFIDPFNDLTNGFSFGANAAGAQWDGTMYEGKKVDLNWDNKWTSKVKNYTDKWVLEMAIPFSSLQYKNGVNTWGINFSRNDLRSSEKSSWAPMSRQFTTSALAYTGNLIWDEPPPPSGANISIIPYLLGGISKDHENGTPTKYSKNIGVDAKIAINSSLNLDLTVNPDFSQVEIDQQVTNLDRYELFFPEKRQFFLVNGDLFANFGYASIRPFFSRRIGLGVPINYGARVSGRLDKNWRIGAMDMQTGKVSSQGLPSQNFTVAAIQRRVFSRSNIGMIFVNKQSLHYKPGTDSSKEVYSEYNRNVGLEYNLASPNNMWTGKAMVLKSFTPGKNENDFVHAAHLQYNSRRWLLYWEHEYVGKNYNAEVGYVPRNGYFKINPQAGYSFFPKGGIILSHGPTFIYTLYTNESFRKTDDQGYLTYNFNFRNQSLFTAWVSHDYVELQKPFDPTNFKKDTLARGTKHSWYAWGSDFVSKPKSLFTYGLSTRFGGYYANGSRYNIIADVGYRFQPYVSMAINVNYNDISLPAPWNHTKFWLVGPKIDVTMTNKLFFNTFVQYNEQLNNINLNTRFQWRYNPASDLYIVYTDNYLPAPFSVRNRALMLKLTYWWNLKVSKKSKNVEI
ncbi:MAG: DUF5916 domain-containing protein [Bacteroidota bacterium]|nr:DUF5916 domain-containing protein [Bacteroidota bacterium]